MTLYKLLYITDSQFNYLYSRNDTIQLAQLVGKLVDMSVHPLALTQVQSEP